VIYLNLDELKKVIEELRDEMREIIKENGEVSERLLEKSKELDNILNDYQQFLDIGEK